MAFSVHQDGKSKVVISPPAPLKPCVPVSITNGGFPTCLPFVKRCATGGCYNWTLLCYASQCQQPQRTHLTDADQPRRCIGTIEN